MYLVDLNSLVLKSSCPQAIKISCVIEALNNVYAFAAHPQLWTVMLTNPNKNIRFDYLCMLKDYKA